MRTDRRRGWRCGRAWCALALVFFPLLAQAQVGRWTAHTSMREVVALATSSDAIWAATTGGVFGFRPADGAFQRFTPVEGLSGIEATAIAYDEARDELWIGYQDGLLDRLDVASGQVRTIRDIRRADQFPTRQINRILVRGDSVFVATSFGIVVYDPVRNEVRDSYSRLGSLPPATPVFDVVVAPVPTGTAGLWAATDRGVAWAALTTSNLQDPSAWTVETDGLPGSQATTRSVAFFEGSLYVGTLADLYRRGAEGRYSAVGIISREVGALVVQDDRLFGIERFNLIVVESGGAGRVLQTPGFAEPSAVMPGPDGNLWFGDRIEGLVVASMPGTSTSALDILDVVTPDGPFNDQFTDLTVGVDGSLWAAEVGASNSGFYRRTPDGTWTSFLGRFFPLMQGTGRYTSIHADAAGNAWAGSEGGGLVMVAPEGTLTRFTKENSSLLPAGGTTDFIIVGGEHTDSDGGLWVTTRASSRPLHYRAPDGTWTALPPLTGQGLTSASTAYGRIFIDSFDQKWIIVHNENDLNQIRGLMVLDTGADPADPSDDAFRFFGQPGAAGRGLPGTVVTSVVEDREGLIWIGTTTGLAFMINTGIVAREESNIPSWPLWADRSRGTFVLFGLRVNDLAVDPANRLWVATDAGAWLIEAVPEGGYDLVTHLSTDNTPLFSNNILAVTVDERTGEVFLATDRGLLSYQGDAIAPAERASELFVYPNPVQLSGGETADIFIEGLVEETELRILSANGTVVTRISTRGGRARWDGRDLTGAPVPSGVYLVVAVGQRGEGTAYGKVAVIR